MHSVTKRRLRTGARRHKFGVRFYPFRSQFMTTATHEMMSDCRTLRRQQTANPAGVGASILRILAI